MDKSITDVKSGLNFLYNNMSNVEEEVINESAKKCYIFFSSNGLFLGKTYEEFQKVMLEENRYEWKSIVSAMRGRKDIGKVIYVRDVYQMYYMRGISCDYASIEAVIELLGEMTTGYEVTTVGISGGGYMAVICGCRLKAKRAFSISGQFDLALQLPEETLRIFKENNEQYVCITDLIDRNGNVPIYYLCPQNCAADYEQLQLVKEKSSVRCFLFPDRAHAATVYPFNFPDLLCLSNEKLDKLEKHYHGKNIDKKFFLLRTLSFRGAVNVIKRGFKSKFSINNMKKMWDIAGNAGK